MATGESRGSLRNRSRSFLGNPKACEGIDYLDLLWQIPQFLRHERTCSQDQCLRVPLLAHLGLAAKERFGPKQILLTPIYKETVSRARWDFEERDGA